MNLLRSASALLLAVLACIHAGCSGRPALIPNPDKNLRKTSAEMAADAAKRHPYKSDAPRGGDAVARAQVGYSLDRVELVNLSADPWMDVELWVNETYVVFLPKVEPKTLKIINFQMLFDNKGHSFPTNNKKILVNKVEVLRDGKMYDVKLQLGD